MERTKLKMANVKSHTRKGRKVAAHTRKTKSAPSLAKAKNIPTKTREKLASKGKALPDGSFPISSKRDLANAIVSVHRAKNVPLAKSHIKKMAKQMGMSKMVNF